MDFDWSDEKIEQLNREYEETAAKMSQEKKELAQTINDKLAKNGPEKVFQELYTMKDDSFKTFYDQNKVK